MAALMNLRLFKLCLLVASVLLMFLGVGVIVFGTTLGTIPTYAVGVLSVMVWLCCAVSAITRWLRSQPPYQQLGSKVTRTGTWEAALPGGARMLDLPPGRLTGPIASESHFDRLISDPSAGWEGLVPLVTLDAGDGTILEARSFDPAVLQIAIGRLQKSPPSMNPAVRPRNGNRLPASAGEA
jgi:hypothetical protein